MLFSSTTFLYLFLPIVLFFNFIVFKKSRLLQNIFLLFASLFFYAWGEPKFVLVMIASIIINWFFGLMVSKQRENKRISRLLIGLDVAFNLAILFVFKYLTFTGNIIDSIFVTDYNTQKARNLAIFVDKTKSAPEKIRISVPSFRCA